MSVGTYSTTGALLSSFDAGDVYNSDTPPLDFPLFNFHSLSARNAAYVEEPAAFALTWKTHDLNVAHGIKDVGDCEASKIVSKL